MAPRGRSAAAGDDAHADRSYDSSPDPLALSFDATIPTSGRKPMPRDSMARSSPTKQDRRLGASEMMFSSPTKSMIMSTPRAGGASPWRIKVTVQAEPGSDEVNAESPSVKRVTRTKTTTVPLKDHDASSPVKRPRGRPRKSDVGATPKPKRKGTPVKRAARSTSPETNMKAGESSAADVDTDVPPKKRRGRPRKNVQLPPETSNTREGSARDVTPAQPSSSNSGTSQKSARFSDRPAPTTETMSDALMEAEELPNLSSPIQRSMRQDIRTRQGTPHANRVVLMESDEHEDEGSDVLTPASGEEDGDPIQTGEAVDVDVSEDGHASLPTPSESSVSSSDAGDDHGQAFEDDEPEDGDAAEFASDQATTRMVDDTTIQNESFTMISLDTLLSNGARSPPKPQEMQNTTAATVRSSLRNEYTRPSSDTTHDAGPSNSRELAPPPPDPYTAPTDSGRPKSSRFVTPVVDADLPSAPPALESVRSKSQTPTLGRVVTAGVALQGLLDPNRLSLTPEPSQQALNQKRGSLDDLFRGFSEGTRKELQAGLRLGEQLAEGQTHEDSAPGPSSPVRRLSATAPRRGVFRTQRKSRQSRLITPEDQDHVATPEVPITTEPTPAEPTAMASEVQYPNLNVEEEAIEEQEEEEAPLSPARSEGEMSWRADTPPAKRPGLPQRNNGTEETQQDQPAGRTNKPAQWDDYADIWQEEASRSLVSAETEEVPAEKEESLHDIFTENIPAKPARGQLLREWRRKRANEARRGGEVEPPKEPSPAEPEPEVPDQPEDGEEEQGSNVITPLSEDKPMQDGDESSPASEASDDTGMFFQSNVPNVFNQKQPSRFEQRRQRLQEKEKVSLEELLDQGDSYVPESSPPVVTRKPSARTKTNPFIDTPPRFPALMSSPKKSSPLRRELQSADISTSSVQFEESTLPLVQSSPFHTIVEGDSKISAASDQRQFRVEMEGDTASTIVRVREEANEYLDAYEPQERTLNEITEITEEPSRLASSPSRMQQRLQQSLLAARKPSPLSKVSPRSHESSAQSSSRYSGPQVVDDSVESSSSAQSQASPEVAAREQLNLLDRVKSTIIRPPPPAPHPIISRLTPLPKIEPWTRTHYKALDKLYTTHLKHPALFCPSIVPPTPLSNTNGYLLRQFISRNGNLPYVGATFHAWGYSMVMTEELVVMCSVFMQLLSLENEEEYYEVTGKRLQMGDCAPGVLGELITGQEVLRRLATVVMGESVRRDEREGRQIDRSGGLEVEWPRSGR
ncbi:hypothetical protein ACET3X_001698 [Alternaria dauci]|uniref:Uncharacterized protein n=1 Tax=Alternaria dauci TaxID=48095 RepID=A0ABR3UY16_9PLEO